MSPRGFTYQRKNTMTMTNSTFYKSTINALRGLNSAQAISEKARELFTTTDADPEDFVEVLIAQHKAAGERVKAAHEEFERAVERYDKLDSMISALAARDRARRPSPPPAGEPNAAPSPSVVSS